MTLLQPRRRRAPGERDAEERAGVRVSSGLRGPAPGLAGLTRHPRYGLAGGVADRRVVDLDEDEARRHSAVFACRDLIARVISTLPAREVRRDADGRMSPVPDPAPWLEEATDDGRLLGDVVYALLDSALSTGMAFAEVLDVDRQGYPQQIVDIDPHEMRAWYADGSGPAAPGAPPAGRRVQWFRNEVPVQLWPAGSIWVLHGYPIAGWPISVSPITYAALSISTGLRADEFGDQFFRDSRHPTGVLMFPDAVEPEVRERQVDDWEEALYANRRVRALSHGGTYKPISIAPEESQFLNTVAASVADVARFFGVDPRDIGANVTGQGSLTYSNPWSDNLRLLTRTHRPWVYRLERALSTLRPRGRHVRFDVDEMLRVDARTQADIFRERIRSGYYSANEARRELNLPPIDGGDRHLWPPFRAQLDEPELAAGADSDPDAPGSVEPAVDDPSGDATDGQINDDGGQPGE